MPYPLAPKPATYVQSGQELVPCEICGSPTSMLGTRRCDRCWELETRIRHDPEIAAKIILAALKGTQCPS